MSALPYLRSFVFSRAPYGYLRSSGQLRYITLEKPFRRISRLWFFGNQKYNHLQSRRAIMKTQLGIR